MSFRSQPCIWIITNKLIDSDSVRVMEIFFEIFEKYMYASRPWISVLLMGTIMLSIFILDGKWQGGDMR